MSSFLNSLLSSIGGNEPAKEPTTGSRTGTTSIKKADVTTKNTNPASAPFVAPLKRKADPLPNPPPAKTVRTETSQPRPPFGGLASHPKPGPANAVVPSSTGLLRTEANKQTSLANIKPSGTPAKASSTQTPPSTALPAKKGSYREILERAEAAKAAQADFGQIKHKPVPKDPKLSRKERLAQEAAATQKIKQEARSGKIGTREGRLPSSNLPVKKAAEQVKEKKKPLDLGYKGTMRQANPVSTYTGTMRTQASTPVRPTERIPSKPTQKSLPDNTSTSRRFKYANYSDEEDEEEDEEDYEDESDDMEAAGFDELEEEEQQSLRAARKEDEEALREENEHKRIKAEKRKKLEQLVASRNKK